MIGLNYMESLMSGEYELLLGFNNLGLSYIRITFQIDKDGNITHDEPKIEG